MSDEIDCTIEFSDRMGKPPSNIRLENKSKCLLDMNYMFTCLERTSGCGEKGRGGDTSQASTNDGLKKPQMWRIGTYILTLGSARSQKICAWGGANSSLLSVVALSTKARARSRVNKTSHWHK